jgi:1-acyl-sn-glycerol-3-phosphate acyltransferase
LFPEGTSSGGETVLPFKSALLQPAVGQSHPVSVACIQYSADDGDAAAEVCYHGDVTFFSHALNLLGKRAIRATVQFEPVSSAAPDRKALARQLRDAIVGLKNRHPA